MRTHKRGEGERETEREGDRLREEGRERGRQEGGDRGRDRLQTKEREGEEREREHISDSHWRSRSGEKILDRNTNSNQEFEINVMEIIPIEPYATSSDGGREGG
jgi:hypothetical protein